VAGLRFFLQWNPWSLRIAFKTADPGGGGSGVSHAEAMKWFLPPEPFGRIREAARSGGVNDDKTFWVSSAGPWRLRCTVVVSVGKGFASPTWLPTMCAMGCTPYAGWRTPCVEIAKSITGWSAFKNEQTLAQP